MGFASIPAGFVLALDFGHEEGEVGVQELMCERTQHQDRPVFLRMAYTLP